MRELWGKLYIFTGFAIDRSKKYIKTIENHIKIDAVLKTDAMDLNDQAWSCPMIEKHGALMGPFAKWPSPTRPVAHSPTGKVEKEAAPGFTLAGFSR